MARGVRARASEPQPIVGVLELHYPSPRYPSAACLTLAQPSPTRRYPTLACATPLYPTRRYLAVAYALSPYPALHRPSMPRRLATLPYAAYPPPPFALYHTVAYPTPTLPYTRQRCRSLTNAQNACRHTANWGWARISELLVGFRRRARAGRGAREGAVAALPGKSV